MMEDENKNIDDESIPVKQNGIQVSMLGVIIGVTLSLVYLLTVGLLSGLVFRDINACKSNSGALDGLTTTVTPITTKLDGLTTTVTPITTKLDGLTTTVTPITTKLDELTTTVTPITTKLDGQTTTVTPITTKLDGQTTTVTPITTKLDGLTTTVTPITTKLDGLTTTVTPITTKLDGLTTTVTPITTTTQPYIPLIALNATLPSYYDVSNYKLKMNIKFNPYLKTVDNTEFGGQVDITMNLGISTSEIIFHAGSQLLILDPIVITNAATGAIVASVLKAQHGSTINDFHYIKLPTNLNAGNYKLSILFGNTIQSLYNNRGLFAREYLDDLIRRYFIIDQK
jgi:hypothetical protein